MLQAWFLFILVLYCSQIFSLNIHVIKSIGLLPVFKTTGLALSNIWLVLVQLKALVLNQSIFFQQKPKKHGILMWLLDSLKIKLWHPLSKVKHTKSHRFSPCSQKNNLTIKRYVKNENFLTKCNFTANSMKIARSACETSVIRFAIKNN